MKRTFCIVPQYTKYIVCKINHDGRKLYAVSCYNGKYTWTRDYLYAREYSKATAERHVASLTSKDQHSECYTAPIVHF